jgi:hypothetical protein
VHPVALRYATPKMRMHIRIRLQVLGASVGRVVVPRGGAGTTLVDGAVSPASSMMLRVVMTRMVMVGIMPGPAVRLL